MECVFKTKVVAYSCQKDHCATFVTTSNEDVEIVNVNLSRACRGVLSKFYIDKLGC